MHQLVATPFGGRRLILRPGSTKAVQLPLARFEELRALASASSTVPQWLIGPVRAQWNVDLTGRSVGDAILVREAGPYEFSRATWEINLGCDLDCSICYLGEKKFEGLDMDGKRKLLAVMRDAGVIWLQITGGEPLIDRDFPESYQFAHEMGMLLELLSNGSRLRKPHILNLLRTFPPAKLTLSVYGATAETYDTVTRRRGGFDRFREGLEQAVDAGLNIDLSLIIVRENAHEVEAMRDWARQLGVPYREYANISPTIHGTAEPLPSQSPQYLTNRAPFTGCPAGVTFFHADPFGRASICKVGREPNIDLIAEGVEGLTRLGGIAESLMLRTGGCSGCKLSDSCRVCRPMAKVFQEAKAPLVTYCQHGMR
ncbi:MULTISPECIES: radical SAM protein [unclassified Streptomyces]|uniref:radical SAM protein n=1 Tax=unclassified Streptomyces TaxID=2593676 RepID=UPI002E8118E8|nr:radical SAM protein [Streptomyces sp. NBC_00589]WTI37455.1 radical SAM protein [Streptomyces sp. NBC_00775]WUB28868.1 radical SAM protein [Streptomyces sp. NBC_00589]